MDFNSRKSTRGLKKTGINEWFDKQSGNMFYKDSKGNLKMKIDIYERQLHKQTMERLRYYEKKTGISTKQARQRESKRWTEYTKSVKQWNNGTINRASTVTRRRKQLEQNNRSVLGYYSKFNTRLQSDMDEKRKVIFSRARGVHNIHNGKEYDNFIQAIATRLNVTVTEIEKILFPKGLEEYSKYVDMKTVIDNTLANIDDLIEKKLKSGEIDETDKFFIRELIDTGKDL